MSDGDSDVPDPRAEMENRGWDIVYKPHEEMARYNAFYNVEFDGERIAPPAAERESVPVNEVWLTEYLRPYERYVLHHELCENRARAAGASVEEAHRRALEADKVFEGNPTWEELWTEINLVPPERVAALEGFDEALFERIQRNRPYCDMAEVAEVPGVDAKRHERLCEAFWCFDCDL